MSDEKKDLVLYAGLYAGSAGVLKVTGFVLFLLIARSVSVDSYAKFGLSYALQTGLAMVALAGITEAVTGLLKENRSSDERRTLFASANSVFALMVVPVTAVSLLLYLSLVSPADSRPITLPYVVVSGLMLGFATLQGQITRLQEKHVASIAFIFVAPLAGFVGGFLAFSLEQTVRAFFVGTAAGIGATLVTLRVLNIGSYEFATQRTEVLPLLRKIGPFLAIAVLGWVGGYGNTYVIELFFTSADVARFTFALMVASILQLTATSLNQVWSPRFYRVVQEMSPQQVERQNRRFYRWQGIALGLIGGSLIVVFPLAMIRLGGNLASYRSMRMELLSMAVAYVLISPWWHCYNYYVVNGEGREVIRLTVAASLVGMAVWLLLMFMLGPTGIYVGFVAQTLLKTLAIVNSAKKRWPLTIAWEGVVAGVFLVLVGFGVSAL